MRLSLEEVMEKLGVDRVMSSYESQPWMLSDEKKGVTCSAEVRMGPACEDLQTEVQLLYAHGSTILPKSRKRKPRWKYSPDPYEYQEPVVDENGVVNPIYKGREQVLVMRMVPTRDHTWKAKSLHVKGKNYRNAFHEWEIKGCDLFRSIVEAMLMGEIPDIDELADRTMCDGDGRRGGRRGRIGRKSPKIKPGSLLGIKKGM